MWGFKLSRNQKHGLPEMAFLATAIFLCAFVPPAFAHGLLSYGRTVGPFVMAPEDLDMPPIGRVRLGTGITHLYYQRVVGRPPFYLSRIPLTVEVGLSANVSMIGSWDVRFRREEGKSVGGVGDVAIATKVRVLDERGQHPAIGLKFLTKLPNARDSSSYLGTDATDFFAALILEKESLSLSGGVAILGSFNSARSDNQQDDFATFSARWSTMPLAGVELSLGSTGFISSRHRDDYAYAIVSAAARWGRNAMQISLRQGLTHDSEAVGISFDLTFELGKR